MTKTPDAEKRMIVFAGPNGSGKSTITEELKRRGGFPKNYINADDIARSELRHIPDDRKRNMEAAKRAEQRRREALENGRSFAFETVMSTPGKLAIFQEAKAKGFQVDLVFVTTFDAEINIGRVANRVALGGHGVNREKVRERYERAMRLLPSAVDLANNADVFDNSGEKPLHVARKRGDVLKPLNTAKAHAWVQERLVVPFRARAASRSRMERALLRRPTIIREARTLLKAANICHGQAYRGVIVVADEYYVVQNIEAGTFIFHDRALCPPMEFPKGTGVTVFYCYEHGGKHKAVAATTAT